MAVFLYGGLVAFSRKLLRTLFIWGDMKKICSKCGIEKPIGEFGKSSESKDRRKYSCKSCRNKGNIEYRKTHKVRCYIPATGITRKCNICKKVKPIERFGKNCCDKLGREHRCRKCSRQYGRKIESINRKKCIPIPVETLNTVKKLCPRCQQAKLLKDFYLRKGRKIGVTPRCKSCWREIRMNKWRTDDKYKKKLLKYSQQYNKTHQKEKSKYNFEYGQANKARRCLRVRNRRKTDLNFKIRCNLQATLNRAIKSQNAHKSGRTMELVGCTVDFLKKYIESKFTKGMTWDNYGRKGWSMDHIKPCASFNLIDHREQKICFHYTNLQPLLEPDNVRKSSWYNGKFYKKT